jgi:hypothetical protein
VPLALRPHERAPYLDLAPHQVHVSNLQRHDLRCTQPRVGRDPHKQAVRWVAVEL